MSALGRLLGAGGRELYPGRLSAQACSSKLLPGEHGAFELFYTSPDYPEPSMPLGEASVPLQAEFDGLAHEIVGTGEARGDGLLVTLITRDLSAKTARVKLTNNGPGAYRQFTVCGILHDAGGAIAAVGRAEGPPPPYHLAPGESIDLTVRFDVMADGELRFHALGLLDAPYTDCCPLGASTWHSVDTGLFSVLLPPGWQYRPQQGIDSFVGEFAGDGVTLAFDYGVYGGSGPTLTIRREMSTTRRSAGIPRDCSRPGPARAAQRASSCALLTRRSRSATRWRWASPAETSHPRSVRSPCRSSVRCDFSRRRSSRFPRPACEQFVSGLPRYRWPRLPFRPTIEPMFRTPTGPRDAHGGD